MFVTKLSVTSFTFTHISDFILVNSPMKSCHVVYEPLALELTSNIVGANEKQVTLFTFDCPFRRMLAIIY